MKQGKSQRGIAFLVIAIAVFFIATVGMTVLAEYSIRDTQRKADSTRLARVYRAIVGDPSKDTFGYLGDVGDYPTTLKDLFESPGVVGWNGPYLSDDFFSGSTVNDSYGSPMEYYLKLAPGATDELTIISKGPDHGSSNTASNANDRTQFSSPYPSDGATYTNGAGNADNLAYPDFSTSPTTAVDYQNVGTLDYDLVNKDANQGGAIVGACPQLYSLVVTSRSRGASDTMTLPYTPGVTSSLPQGLYDISILSVQALSDYLSESVAIYSGRTSSRRIRVENIDSNSTPTFSITLNNRLSSGGIQFKRFGSNVGGVVAAGSQTTVSGVKACGVFTAVTSPGGVTIDTWVNPWANSTHTTGSISSSLTVTNANGGGLASRRQIQVYDDGVLVGTVYQRKTVVFSNMYNGSTIVVKDQPGTAQIDSFTMPSAATSKTY